MRTMQELPRERERGRQREKAEKERKRCSSAIKYATVESKWN